jgi:hypothetical protein
MFLFTSFVFSRKFSPSKDSKQKTDNFTSNGALT